MLGWLDQEPINSAMLANLLTAVVSEYSQNGSVVSRKYEQRSVPVSADMGGILDEGQNIFSSV